MTVKSSLERVDFICQSLFLLENVMDKQVVAIYKVLHLLTQGLLMSEMKIGLSAKPPD